MALKRWFRDMLLFGIGSLLVVALAVIFFLNIEPAQCVSEVIVRSESPDGLWTALVTEETCSDGAFTTTISDTVQLVRTRGSQGIKEDVFSVDQGGHVENRPTLQWLAPSVLEIAVPNKSLIGINKAKYKEVVIRVRFYPNDPEERKRWLKEIKEPKGSP